MSLFGNKLPSLPILTIYHTCHTLPHPSTTYTTLPQPSIMHPRNTGIRPPPHKQRPHPPALIFTSKHRDPPTRQRPPPVVPATHPPARPPSLSPSHTLAAHTRLLGWQAGREGEMEMDAFWARLWEGEGGTGRGK